MMPRPMMILVPLLLAGSARSAHAQQELAPVVDYVTAAWARGDADAVAAAASSAGITLDLEDGPIGPVGPRQSAAALRRVFDDRETVSIRKDAARLVGEPAARAFAEFEWSVRARGTRIPETLRVFLALVHEETGWRVTQIRLIR